jgi:hypothetical protein
MMDEHNHLPDVNRLSVLVAVILLAYALTPFVNMPERGFAFQLPGMFVVLRFTFPGLISAIAAILAATGSAWLFQNHPHYRTRRTRIFWLLPALSAWAVGTTLGTLEVGPEWWAVFALGGILLVLVLLAEYIVLDDYDIRHAPASIGLTAVSYGLYLILAVAARAAGLRLYEILAMLVPSMALLSLRTLFLRLNGRWCVAWALGIALFIGQLAIGLHYFPTPPLRYALLLVGPAYAATSLASGIEEGRPLRRLWLEPAVMLAAILSLAFLLPG